MKPLISIVIPAYNSAKYISKCIKSIKEQTFNNYEVIIIDDGSTDDTLSVIKKNITNKFKVISQKNCGQGIARNEGIKLATGKYIAFMDSDDFLYDNFCLEKLSKVILKKDYDVVIYKMVRYYEKKNKYLVEDNITTDDKHFKNIYDYLHFTIENSRLSVSQCDKIIKSDILKNKGIYFKKMSMLEDVDWSLRLYENIKTLKVFNEPIYVYRQNVSGSVSSFNGRKKSEDCLAFISNWCKECKPEKNKYQSLYLNYISYQYTIMMAHLTKHNCSKENLNKLKEYKWLLKYDLNFKVRKVNFVYKIVGYKLTIIILKLYIFLKEKNLILIR